MDPMFLQINQEKTGLRIHQLMDERGFSVNDVKDVMGFANPQAVYHWLNGRSLPSLDNLYILSQMLKTPMDDILVVDGDVIHHFFMPAA